MIKYLINNIICVFNDHKMINAGSCPFTGKTYNICTRCGKTVPLDNKNDL
jgi:hypothetical protein